MAIDPHGAEDYIRRQEKELKDRKTLFNYVDVDFSIYERAWDKVKEQAEIEWEGLKYHHSSWDRALSYWTLGAADPFITSYYAPITSKEYWLAQAEVVLGSVLGAAGGMYARKASSLLDDAVRGIENIFTKIRGKGKVSFSYDNKIANQMNNRGWNDNLVQDTLQNPHKTQVTRDTRFRPDGTRNNDPATAYIREDGSYVVRNDRTGNIVQVSDRNDTNWTAPWD